MVIVNWNIEWASPRSPREKNFPNRIFDFNPEVICLTEANLDFPLEPGYIISSEEDYGYRIVPGRRKVVLWSKRPSRR
jgi:hypothetical protein